MLELQLRQRPLGAEYDTSWILNGREGTHTEKREAVTPGVGRFLFLGWLFLAAEIKVWKLEGKYAGSLGSFTCFGVPRPVFLQGPIFFWSNILSQYI